MNRRPLLFSGPTIDPALPANPRERVRYSHGQLLGADEFTTDQQYHLLHHRLHQVALHGMGVARGLNVGFADDELTVGPGLAVDPLGRNLLLTQVKCLAVPLLHTTDAWQDFELASEDEFKEVRRAWIVLRYRSHLSDPVSTYSAGCGSSSSQTRPSRICDGVIVELEATRPEIPNWVPQRQNVEPSGEPGTWRQRLLRIVTHAADELHPVWDGSQVDHAVCLAEVRLHPVEDGAGGTITTVAQIDPNVRPILPSVQMAVDYLSNEPLLRPSPAAPLRLARVKPDVLEAGESIVPGFQFPQPLQPGTVISETTFAAHSLGDAWEPVEHTVEVVAGSPNLLRVKLAPVEAGRPIRITLVGDGPTPICTPDGKPLSGWLHEATRSDATRGRTVAYTFTAPSEEAP